MIQYVKYNKILLKPGKRDHSTKVILEFFKKVQKRESKMKGFIVMDSLDDPYESIVLTFWETKEEMDNFYEADNRLLSDLVEKLKPIFETLPERRGYHVSDLQI
jgi:heme-degrading monooxygenase HmoA